MLTLFFGIILAALLFLGISLLKTYHHVPIRELKRQANQGDEISQVFYRVVAFGFSLDMFLWVVIAIAAGGFFVFLSKNLPWPVALFGCVACVWFGFAWMPGSHITKSGVVVARILAKPIAMILEWLHTPLTKTSNVIDRYRPVTVHTGLYTKQDLIEFVEQQQSQIDNRVSKKDLSLVMQALLISDKEVADIMTPWRKVVEVATHDMVGPVLMDELHKSGHTHFPVYQGGDKKDIVGVLNIADMLDAKEGGFVKDIMIKRVYYLHESEKVSEVFSTLAETKHPLFLVVSNKEELIGVLSLSEVLSHMVGDLPESEFGNHHDKAAVARKKQPKVTHVDETIELEDEDKKPNEKIEPVVKKAPEPEESDQKPKEEPTKDKKTETEDEK